MELVRVELSDLLQHRRHPVEVVPAVFVAVPVGLVGHELHVPHIEVHVDEREDSPPLRGSFERCAHAVELKHDGEGGAVVVFPRQ